MKQLLDTEPVMAALIAHLDPPTKVALMLSSRPLLLATALQVYRAPRLDSSDSFERLMDLINMDLPFTRYASFIRELAFESPAAADNIYMGDLDHCITLCSSLELFKLENCYHISNILIKALAQSECADSLLHVAIRGCPISDTFIPLLAANCSVLERLDLADTNVTIASLYSIVSRATALISLDLSEARDSPLPDIQGIPPPNTPNALFSSALDFSRLNLNYCLKFVNLSSSPVTDPLVSYLADCSPNLATLLLDSCTNLTDASIAHVIEKCHMLEHLDCSFIDGLTDASLNALTRISTPNLHTLCLSACDGISPSGVARLANAAQFSLRLLMLDGCDQIMGSEVHTLATHHTELECTFDGAADIRALAATYEDDMDEDAAFHTAPSTPVSSSAMDPRHRKLSYKSPLGEGVRIPYKSPLGEGARIPYKYPLGDDRRPSHKSPPGDTVPRKLSRSSASPSSPTSPIALRASAVSSTSITISGSKRSSKLLRSQQTLSTNRRDSMSDSVRWEREEKIREKRRSTMYHDYSAADPPSSPEADDSAASRLHDFHRGLMMTRRTDAGSESVDGDASEGTSVSSTASGTAAPVVLASGRGRKYAEIDTAVRQAGMEDEDTAALHEQFMSGAPFKTTLIASGRRPRPDSVQSDAPRTSPSPPRRFTSASPMHFSPPHGSEWAQQQQPASVDVRGKWGEMPEIWTNPAQMTSSSSTWNRNAPGIYPPPHQHQPVMKRHSSFQDPWGQSWQQASPPAFHSPQNAYHHQPQSSPPAFHPPQNAYHHQPQSSPPAFHSPQNAYHHQPQSSPPAFHSPQNAYHQQPQSPYEAYPQYEASEWGQPIQSPLTTTVDAGWISQPRVSPPPIIQARPLVPIVITRPPSKTTAPAVASSVEKAETDGSIVIAKGRAGRSAGVDKKAKLDAGRESLSNDKVLDESTSSGAVQVKDVPAETEVRSENQKSELKVPAKPKVEADVQREEVKVAPTVPDSPGEESIIASTAEAPREEPKMSPTEPDSPGEETIVSPSETGAPDEVPKVSPTETQAPREVSPIAAPEKFNVPSSGAESEPEIREKEPSILTTPVIKETPATPPHSGLNLTSSDTVSAKSTAKAAAEILATPPLESQAARTSEKSASVPKVVKQAENAEAVFKYSRTVRGKMLLKLKIQTKMGGHQTLAVHELDDPAELSGEFCRFWKMDSFKDPLFRLISVRRANALRQKKKKVKSVESTNE